MESLLIYENKEYESLPGETTELIYNNPFGHKTNEFLDQFNLTLQAMGSLYNQNFAINIDGLLYSIPTYFYNDSLSNMGITYKYDIFNIYMNLFISFS